MYLENASSFAKKLMPKLIPKHAIQRFIILDPVPDLDHPVMVFVVPYVNGLDPCVDDHAFAHGAAVGIADILPRGHFPAGQIDGSPDHPLPLCADDGVGLSVNAAAQLVALPPRNIHLLTDADAKIRTVFPPPGSAYIPGGDHLIVFYNHCAV